MKLGRMRSKVVTVHVTTTVHQKEYRLSEFVEPANIPVPKTATVPSKAPIPIR
jgi:hypothetical protein